MREIEKDHTAHCLVCGSIAPHVGDKNGFPFYRCGECALLFVWPLPQGNLEIYSEDYFAGARDGFGYVDYDLDKSAMTDTFESRYIRLDLLAGSGAFPQLGDLARVCVMPRNIGTESGGFCDRLCGQAVFHSDGWRGYLGLEESRLGYRVTHTAGDSQIAAEEFAHVHLVASKRWLVATHQGKVSKVHLQGYLDEFTFRFNRRRTVGSP